MLSQYELVDLCVNELHVAAKNIEKFRFEWPEHMNCDLFPEYGSVKDVCMDPVDALNVESKELFPHLLIRKRK
jgi:hypothetical protein